jgi:hypothetical protein
MGQSQRDEYDDNKKKKSFLHMRTRDDARKKKSCDKRESQVDRRKENSQYQMPFERGTRKKLRASYSFSEKRLGPKLASSESRGL